MVVIFCFLLIRPQSQRQKHREMIDKVRRRGDTGAVTLRAGSLTGKVSRAPENS